MRDRAPDPTPPESAEAYWRTLAPFGRVTARETEYVQHLPPVAYGHPMRWLTESTLLRPILAGMDVAEQSAYLTGCDAALARVCPALPDGGVLFPFRRVFFILKVQPCPH